jgi:phage protein U
MAWVTMGMGPVAPSPDESDYILFYVPIPGMDSPSFDSIQRDSQFTWASNDRLGRDPAMQFTGPGEDHITIEGKMFPFFFGGLSTLERLRVAGRKGKPMRLVRFYPLDDPGGLGSEVVGNTSFVITRVRSVENNIGRYGIAHKIDFTIELKRYGEDDPGAVSTDGSAGWIAV